MDESRRWHTTAVCQALWSQELGREATTAQNDRRQEIRGVLKVTLGVFALVLNREDLDLEVSVMLRG